jgi:dTDP-4-dehydrorhamnose 3,5-epimerase-like enzyme
MIPVVTLIQGRKSTDDRGSVSFINDFDPTKYGVRRFYVVQNHRAGFIRAWHGHKHESKFVTVIRGVAIIKAISIENGDETIAIMNRLGRPSMQMDSFVMSGDNPQVLCIPAGYYNGFINLTPDTIIQFFSNRSVEESKDDDIRLPWDKFGSKVWAEDYR